MPCPECGNTNLIVIDEEQACERCRWHTSGFRNLKPPDDIDLLFNAKTDEELTRFEELAGPSSGFVSLEIAFLLDKLRATRDDWLRVLKFQAKHCGNGLAQMALQSHEQREKEYAARKQLGNATGDAPAAKSEAEDQPSIIGKKVQDLIDKGKKKVEARRLIAESTGFEYATVVKYHQTYARKHLPKRPV